MVTCKHVLAQLTKSGIWSSIWTSSGSSNTPSSRAKGHIVLDAESIVAFLYQYCARRHAKRATAQTNSSPHWHSYATSLVNYAEFGQLVERLLECLIGELALSPVIVYRGALKSWDARERVSEALSAMQQLEGATGSGSSSDSLAATTPPPNLALNIFKQIVNQLHKQRGLPLRTHQAFYCAYASMAKLARDLKCPVLCNEGDFILMDVRAGFILFEDFFKAHLEDAAQETSQRRQQQQQNVLSRFPSTASNSSTASSSSVGSSASTASAKSSGVARARSAGSRRSLKSSSSKGSVVTSPSVPAADAQRAAAAAKAQPPVKLRLHLHRLFLRQHPGLSPPLALQLFPLTANEFLAKYSDSLTRIHVYERDLVAAASPSSKQHLKQYHLAAARLEAALRFLCARTAEILPNLIRGEASKHASPSIEDDYRELFEYHAVAYDFRGHLKHLLEARRAGGTKSQQDKQQVPLDAVQLNHIQSCLLERECTADFWLSLLSASAAASHARPTTRPLCPLAIDYNRSMQFEDLKTRQSARALLDRPKCVMMSVLGADHNKVAAAALKVVDRRAAQLIERTLSAKQLATDLQQVPRVTLPAVARKSLSKQDASALMNCAFGVTARGQELTKLESARLEHTLARLKPAAQKQSASGGGGQEGVCQAQLAVLLSLHKFCLEQASQEDRHFVASYARLNQHFEIGLVNHHLYLAYVRLTKLTSASATAQSNYERATLAKDLKQLIELINAHNLENVANLSGFSGGGGVSRAAPQAAQKSPARSPKKDTSSSSSTSAARSPAKSPKSSSASSAGAAASTISSENSGAAELRKQVRHLLELFNSSLEAYCELNAFLNYPMPKLAHLHTSYNPILLYNLILFSCEQPINTKLIKF